MMRMTIRVDDYIYDRVNLLAKENKTSANKIIGKFIKENVCKNHDEDYSLTLNKKLDSILGIINKIDKRQIAHFKVTKQEFANRGYLANADVEDDKCLKQILTNKFY